MTTKWQNPHHISTRSFTCAYCDNIVSSFLGLCGSHPDRSIYICPHCSNAAFFDESRRQHPAPVPGTSINHLPKDIEALYAEARRCVAAGAPTSAVLACRKLLMNIAVAQGAKEGASFIAYVEHLASDGYVPPNGRHWVDHIRKKGNEANHEIQLMLDKDARELIDFAAMLLKFVYEFPARVPKAP
jgi:Domain of unknown function (DUF4145)